MGSDSEDAENDGILNIAEADYSEVQAWMSDVAVIHGRSVKAERNKKISAMY